MALVFPRLICNFIVTGTAGNWSRVARVSGLSVNLYILRSLYANLCQTNYRAGIVPRDGDSRTTLLLPNGPGAIATNSTGGSTLDFAPHFQEMVSVASVVLEIFQCSLSLHTEACM